MDHNDLLSQRVRTLTIALVALSVYTMALTMVVLSARSMSKPSDVLSVRRLSIVDAKGVERAIVAAPLPDPVVAGKRVPRKGVVSGLLIYDPNGNERGGYVTSDAGDLGAFLSLDSDHGQVFTAYANPDSGATVWATNDNGDRITFSTYQEPSLQVIQNNNVTFKTPPTAPDLR